MNRLYKLREPLVGIDVISSPYRVVRRAPSSRGSDSIVMAWAGQMASHSLQAESEKEEASNFSNHNLQRAPLFIKT